MSTWLCILVFIVLPHVLLAIKVFAGDVGHARNYTRNGRVSGPYGLRFRRRS